MATSTRTKTEYHHLTKTYKSSDQEEVNFEELSKKHPEFSNAWKKVKEHQRGSNSKSDDLDKTCQKRDRAVESFSTHLDMDFNVSLCRAIMHERYKTELPNLVSNNGRLCPAVPNRVNYVRWIRDILSLFHNDGDDDNQLHYQGIDIGVGASCIYPLLLATHEFSTNKKWRFVGTEIDEVSYNSAKENIKANELQNRIHLLHLATKEKPLISALNELFSVSVSKEIKIKHQEIKKEFDFCMTNPPFFNEETIATLPKRRDKRCRTEMTNNESITKGGEYEFISKILQDSLETRTQITWYTSLVGHKKTLERLEKEFNFLGFGWSNVLIANFVQGDKKGLQRRWGIAWTFMEVPVRSIAAKVEKTISFRVNLTPQDPSDVIEDANNTLEVINRIKSFCNDQHNVLCSEATTKQNNSTTHENYINDRSTTLTITGNNTTTEKKESSQSKPQEMKQGRNTLNLLPKEGHFLIDVIIKQEDTQTMIVILHSYIHSSIGSKIVSKLIHVMEGDICRFNRKWRRILLKEK